MYYPYLRARQFELIAVRELAAEGSIRNNVIPVLEPVKESISSLNLANNALLNNGQTAYLILNPLVGELPGDNEYFSAYLASLGNSGFLPAFHYCNNYDFINATINKFNFTAGMLICYSHFTDDAELRELCASASISHVMVLEPQKNRSLDRYIKGIGKVYIRLDDLFEKQEKNANYLNIPAHKLSEEHLYYQQDGYQGFSDFTVLPGEYVEGGSTPRAVVIHLSYINSQEENQIWIRHFTSETNDSIANVQGNLQKRRVKPSNFVKHIRWIIQLWRN